MKRGTPAHYKTVRLAQALGCSRPEAGGLLEFLWHYAAAATPQGDIGRCTDAEIAIGVYDDHHDPATLVRAFVAAGWLDECPVHRLVVHDWPDHADEAVKKWLQRRGLAFIRSHARSGASCGCNVAENDVSRHVSTQEPDMSAVGSDRERTMSALARGKGNGKGNGRGKGEGGLGEIDAADCVATPPAPPPWAADGDRPWGVLARPGPIPSDLEAGPAQIAMAEKLGCRDPRRNFLKFRAHWVSREHDRMAWTSRWDSRYESWLLSHDEPGRGCPCRVGLVASAGPPIDDPAADALFGTSVAEVRRMRAQLRAAGGGERTR